MLSHYAGLAPLLAITADFRRRVASSGDSPVNPSSVPAPAAGRGDTSRIFSQLDTMSRRIDELVSRENP